MANYSPNLSLNILSATMHQSHPTVLFTSTMPQHYLHPHFAPNVFLLSPDYSQLFYSRLKIMDEIQGINVNNVRKFSRKEVYTGTPAKHT